MRNKNRKIEKKDKDKSKHQKLEKRLLNKKNCNNNNKRCRK